MANKLRTVKNFFTNNIHILIVLFVGILCTLFIVFGTKNENGFITLDGSDAKIEQSTLDFIEDSKTALNRIMNEDRPTDDETVSANDSVEGLGFYVDIPTIMSRRLASGSVSYQCSRYTAYLATGKSVYSTAHIDYGPVNGKNVAAWLVQNYGFKYIDTPVEGAIGSGGFDTQYGHTALFLYSTGEHTAMVEDANYSPLAVAVHNMNIDGWVWVVPGNYSPESSPEPQEGPSNPGDVSSTYLVVKGDTLGEISRKTGWYTGGQLYGDNGYAQKVAEYNGITNRGLIYPGTLLRRPE